MKINSRICSVKELFDGKTRYIVPSYNKNYKYLRICARDILPSIIQNYQSGEEQCFAGTIMLSGKNEILDGCLRLQCLSIFLKELSFLFLNNEELKSLTFDWLETKVSSLEQENLLKYFSCKSSDETDEQDESFGETAILLRQNLAHLNLFKGKNRIDSESFISYLLNNVVFNVVKNTENSQWDLFYMSHPLKPVRYHDLEDIFCENLIEYLTDVKGMSEKEAAEKVFDLYLYSLEADKKVLDLYNCSAKEDLYPDEIETIKKRCYTEKSWRRFDINSIIKKYQIILITKYRLSSSLLWEEESVFFRKLFASLLKKENYVPEEFKGVELDLDEIKRIIDITFDLIKINKTDMCSETEQMLNYTYRMTQYKGYVGMVYNISTTYLFFHEGDIEGMKKVLVELYKLFFVYDICTFNTSKVDSFMEDFLQNINESCDELLEKISCKKNEIDMELLKKKFLRPSGKDEREKMTRIEIVCRLFEFLKMKDQDKFDLKDLTSSYNDRYSLILIQDVFKTRIWHKSNLKESIGNMALVERNISQKVTQRTSFLERKKIFKKSKLYTSHLISCKKDWSEEDAQKRNDEMTEEITSFLFSDLTKSQKEA